MSTNKMLVVIEENMTAEVMLKPDTIDTMIKAVKKEEIGGVVGIPALGDMVRKR